MSDSIDLVSAASRISAFATLGAMGVTQDLAQVCLADMNESDPELVAEETLCLVATASARAAEVGLEAVPTLAGSVSGALLALPYTFGEYLVGGAMIAQQKPELAEAHGDVVRRLDRKTSFYQVHLPAGQFPGQHALNDKMALWMGRISPPGLPDMPTARLERLDLVPTLVTHARLVLAFARKAAAEVSDG